MALTSDEVRILNIILAEYSVKLKEADLNLESAISDQKPITKNTVVSCLQCIGQHHLATILSQKRGKNYQFKCYGIALGFCYLDLQILLTYLKE